MGIWLVRSFQTASAIRDELTLAFSEASSDPANRSNQLIKHRTEATSGYDAANPHFR